VAGIDWGYTTATICVAQDARALFTRRVRSCGLAMVCQSIQSSLNVSPEETQHLLLSFGLPHERSDETVLPLQQALARAAQEHLSRLVEEIRRTLAYFQAQRRELIPGRIWLLGGGACVRNSAAWLSHECGVPIHPWHLPASSSDDGASQGETVAASESAPLFATAIALSALPVS
jgi:Tfp pilus assembly PilM family ATPase